MTAATAGIAVAVVGGVEVEVEAGAVEVAAEVTVGTVLTGSDGGCCEAEASCGFGSSSAFGGTASATTSGGGVFSSDSTLGGLFSADSWFGAVVVLKVGSSFALKDTKIYKTISFTSQPQIIFEI